MARDFRRSKRALAIYHRLGGRGDVAQLPGYKSLISILVVAESLGAKLASGDRIQMTGRAELSW